MDFKKAIEEAMEPLSRDIATLCRINSVESEPEEGAPFGKGPAEALETILDMGESMGFRTENFDNYAGHIEFGEGEEILGILGHVDVVPAGDGWDFDPWGGMIHEGKIFGRGTLDDKGPLAACLYAMKILKDSGLPLKRRVRMILGTNEETDWKCMDYYLNQVKPELPTVAFSPDAEFPVTYAEKGMLQFTLTKILSESVAIEGGSAFNSVPSSASAVLPKDMEQAVQKAVEASENPEMYSYEVSEDKLLLRTTGVGAHAAHLEKGRNAVSYLMELLAELPVSGELKSIVDFYRNSFGTTLFGEKLGIEAFDEDSGPLTLNVGQIGEKDGKLVMCCDCRIPVSVPVSEKENQIIDRIAGSGFEFAAVSRENPLYVPKDSELVTTLMGAYRKVTGDETSQPMSSGGATYSRTMKNCVAFGCLLPDQEDTMHQANECLELRHLKIWLEIMVEAVYQLAK